MPDIFDLFSRWWKQILAVVIITIVIAAALVFIKPSEYLSTATAIPSTTVTADKSKIFSDNLEALYSPIGSADDLDLIIGTAALDTIYLDIAKTKGLEAHYKLKSDSKSLHKAALTFKHNSKVMRSDYGELKVKAWDKDPVIAADLANALIEKLQQFHQNVRNNNNTNVINKMRQEYDLMQKEFQSVEDTFVRTDSYSATGMMLNNRRNLIMQQLAQFEKLLRELEFTVNANQQPFQIIEYAKPSLKADRPKRLQTILAAALIGLVFGFLAALILERRRLKYS